VKPKSVADLQPIEREQLRIAGRGYDGHDLAAKDRLAANGKETSFARFVELRTVVDAEHVPLYDVWTYMVDSGSIFVAGTTREIGGVAQGGVVLREPNVALRIALQAMLVRKPPKPPKKKVAKKPRAKKPSAKKKK
jgi:hypothetical protein